MLALVVDDVDRFMGAAPAASDIIMLALRVAALHRWPRTNCAEERAA